MNISSLAVTLSLAAMAPVSTCYAADSSTAIQDLPDNFARSKSDWVEKLSGFEYKGPSPCAQTKGLCVEPDTPPPAAALVHFNHDSSRILPQYNQALKNLGQAMTDQLHDTVLIVQGHTDSTGADAYNDRLSEKRAQAVVSYLKTRYGIASVRLIAEGKGEHMPIADNSTDVGRKLNRRVMFIRHGRYME